MNRLYRLLPCLVLLFFYACAGTPEPESDTAVLPESMQYEETAEVAEQEDTSEKTNDTVQESATDARYPESHTAGEQDDKEDTQEEDTQAELSLPPEAVPDDAVVPLYEPAPVISAVIVETLEPVPLPLPVSDEAERGGVAASTEEDTEEETVQIEEEEEEEEEGTDDSNIMPAPMTLPVGKIPELPSSQDVLAEEEKISYSRTVRATLGQLIEIPFYGSGWVYLGELGSRRGLPYDSRRLDAEGQSFVFRAEAVGTYSLKFYKQDFIRDYILNDYVQVLVGEAPAASSVGGFALPVDRSRVIAQPRWPSAEADVVQAAGTEPGPGMSDGEDSSESSAAESAAPQTSTVQSRPAQDIMSDEGIVTVSPVSPVVPSASPESASGPDYSRPEVYLSAARSAYDEGNFQQALNILDRFRDRYPAGSDEAWWLYGRVLEANGVQRDIRAALGFYRRLVNEYPYSSRYDDARKRINYLERFYIEIR